MDQGTGRRRRRAYSAEFKAEAVAACRRPGASMAAAAIERSMNANVLRRWVVDAERAAVAAPLAMPAPPTRESFVAVPMLPKVADDTPIQIDVRRGNVTLSVRWPRSALHECAIWLREVIK